jgi:hypothetical protein
MMADSTQTHTYPFTLVTHAILLCLIALLPSCSQGTPAQARPPAATLYDMTRVSRMTNLPRHDHDTARPDNAMFISVAGIRAGDDYASIDLVIRGPKGRVAPFAKRLPWETFYAHNPARYVKIYGSNRVIHLSGPPRHSHWYGNSVPSIVHVGGTLIDATSTHDCIVQPITIRSNPKLVPGNEYAVVLGDGLGDFIRHRNPVTVDADARTIIASELSDETSSATLGE